MNIETNAEHPGLLAGVPGFHALARTALTGLAGPGGAVLDVWCACDESTPVARITLRLRPARDPGDFRFVELGRGRIAVTPALDLRSAHGHFVTQDVWQTDPDGWMLVGKVEPGGLKAVRAKMVPRRAVAALAPAVTTGAEDSCASCGHERGFHDPCSKCKAKKPCRSFVEPKSAKRKR